MIPEMLLSDFNAELEHFNPAEIIFEEDTTAHFYYQIKSGEVKMFNLNEAGKEFVQGFFYDGDSFGEPPVFADFKYPASAMATKASEIYRLPKTQLFELLTSHPDIHIKFTQELAKRLFYKATILKGISNEPPETRILTLIDFLKNRDESEDLYQVALTRQQIADMTGLRVETVIRTIKQLEHDGEIQIIKRKVFR